MRVSPFTTPPPSHMLVCFTALSTDVLLSILIFATWQVKTASQSPSHLYASNHERSWTSLHRLKGNLCALLMNCDSILCLKHSHSLPSVCYSLTPWLSLWYFVFCVMSKKFYALDLSQKTQKLIQSCLMRSMYPYPTSRFWIWLRKPTLAAVLQRNSPIFSSSTFMMSNFIFRSQMHFKFYS